MKMPMPSVRYELLQLRGKKTCRSMWSAKTWLRCVIVGGFGLAAPAGTVVAAPLDRQGGQEIANENNPAKTDREALSQERAIRSRTEYLLGLQHLASERIEEALAFFASALRTDASNAAAARAGILALGTEAGRKLVLAERTLRLPAGETDSAVLSPDGRWIASYDGKSVLLRSGKDGTILRTIRTKGTVNRVMFQSDVLLWITSEKELASMLPGATEEPMRTTLPFLPDSLWLSADGKSGIAFAKTNAIPTKTERSASEFPQHRLASFVAGALAMETPITGVVEPPLFSPNGKYVLLRLTRPEGIPDGAEVREVSTGRLLWQRSVHVAITTPVAWNGLQQAIVADIQEVETVDPASPGKTTTVHFPVEGDGLTEPTVRLASDGSAVVVWLKDEAVCAALGRGNSTAWHPLPFLINDALFTVRPGIFVATSENLVFAVKIDDAGIEESEPIKLGDLGDSLSLRAVEEWKDSVIVSGKGKQTVVKVDLTGREPKLQESNNADLKEILPGLPLTIFKSDAGFGAAATRGTLVDVRIASGDPMLLRHSAPVMSFAVGDNCFITAAGDTVTWWPQERPSIGYQRFEAERRNDAPVGLLTMHPRAKSFRGDWICYEVDR